MQRRADRDGRREHSGYIRTTKEQLQARVRCWKCGNIGHIAAQCKSQGTAGSGSGASSSYTRPQRGSYFNQTFVNTSDAFTTFYGQEEQDRVRHTPVLGLLDTGAVNAVAGAHVMLELDDALVEHGLGLAPLSAPSKIIGVGGPCDVLMAVQAPISLGQKCGCLAIAVCKAKIPLLVPLPLLEGLGANIQLGKQRVEWSDGTCSPLERLPSGHVGISLTHGLRHFTSRVLDAMPFVRNATHVETREKLSTAVSSDAFTVMTSPHVPQLLRLHSTPPTQDGASDPSQYPDFGIKASMASQIESGCSPSDERGRSGHDVDLHPRRTNLLEENDAEALAFRADGGASKSVLGGTTGNDAAILPSITTDIHWQGKGRGSTSDSGRNACTTTVEGQQSWQTVPTEARGMSTCNHPCEGLSVRALVPMRRMRGEMAEEQRGILRRGRVKDDVKKEHGHQLLVEEAWQSQPEDIFMFEDIDEHKIANDLNIACEYKKIENMHDWLNFAQPLNKTCRTIGFTQLGAPKETWSDQADIQVHRGLLLLTNSESTPVQREWDQASAERVWELVETGKYQTVILTHGESKWQVVLHPPTAHWSRPHVVDFYTPAWRCLVGFAEQDNSRLKSWHQFWLPLGKRQRAQQVQGLGVLTVYGQTSEDCSRAVDLLNKAWNPSRWSANRPHPGFPVSVLSEQKNDAPLVLICQQKDRKEISFFVRDENLDDHAGKKNLLRDENLDDHAGEKNLSRDENMIDDAIEGIYPDLLPQEFHIADTTVNVNDVFLATQVQHTQDDVRGSCHPKKLFYQMVLAHLQRQYRKPLWNDSVKPKDEQQTMKEFLLSVRFPHVETRRGLEQVSFLGFGLVTSRGRKDVTPATHKRPAVLAAIHFLARQREEPCPYLACGLIRGRSDWHVDSHNQGMSSAMSFGSYAGGLLQVGQKLIDTKDKWITFDATEPHQVTKYTGERLTVVCYTPKGTEAVPKTVWSTLMTTGFPVVSWCVSQVHAPETEEVKQAVQLLVKESVEEKDEKQESQVYALETILEEGDNADAEIEEEEPQAPQRWLPSDGPEEAHVPEVTMLIPTPAQKAAIHRAHCNLGHPKNDEFLRALRLAGVSAGLRQWIKREYTCGSCQSNRPAGIRRPAFLPRSYGFNIVIGLDTIELHPPNLPSEAYLNVVCWGSRLQQVYRMGPTPTAEGARRGLATWIKTYGVPEVTVVDGGPEFKGCWAEYAEHLGIYIHQVDAYAPHQAGKTERAGGLFKEQLTLALETAEIANADELEILTAEVCSARNSFVDRSGYTSHQRVFGRSIRAPPSLLAEDHLSAEQLAMPAKVEYAKADKIRTSALASLFRLDARTRIQRAARARTRYTGDFHAGQWVFVHRRNALGRRWRQGPMVVIMTSGTTIWATLHGHLFKVNKEACRPATTDELRGLEELNEILPELRDETIEKRGRKDYTDLTGESASMEEEMSTHPSQGSTGLDEMESRESASTTEASQASQSERTPKRSSTPRPRKRSLAPQVGERVEQIEEAEFKRQATSGSGALPAMSSLPTAEEELRVTTPEQDQTSEEKVEGTERETAESTSEARERSRSPSRIPETSELLVQKKSDEVKYCEIPVNLLDGFHEAMALEAKSMLQTNHAMEILSEKETQQVMTHRSDRLLKSRWHLKLKDKETADGMTQIPKARWILVGFKDPDLEDLLADAYSPTPSLVVINLALMAIASTKREAYVGDLSQAFLQAQATQRSM
eukprot:5221249-Amphidinium_carterae.1